MRAQGYYIITLQIGSLASMNYYNYFNSGFYSDFIHKFIIT